MTHFEDDSPPLIYSPLNQMVTRQGVTVEVTIYGDGEGKWILDVQDCDSNSHIWDDRFETDQLALDEAIRALEEEPDAFSGTPTSASRH